MERNTLSKKSKAHFKGAMSEYRVASFYLGKGYQVYWPSSHHTGVDCVVEDSEGDLYAVQVKTGYQKGKYIVADTVPRDKRGTPPAKLYDILAVVYKDSLWLIPTKEITGSKIRLAGHLPNYTNKFDRYKRKEGLA